MANGVNKAIIIGNLGADPEVRYTKAGDAIANLSIATSESWKDATTGESKSITTWHKIVLFKRLAEIAKQYLVKGSKVYVEGAMKLNTYTDKEGVKRYSTEVHAANLQMLGDGKKEDSSVGDSSKDYKVAQDPGNQAEFDDDVPF